ncbi:MAG: type II toxin-antitoxin system VapC family toxin [Methanobrevibacter sp.]|uniref:type II toxin-antitoxin system VapC family toxin n=1 Tax=Methanobrevibacter sp. TaxID=66852 RepID=UPI0026DF72BA|nr:type II toxin-antitoxin system VapC family toxin [Methanobrevibacter sp.]MDO5848857.1 type II toxin-antitoxin system VapC family toxin [Methanobrevibacter sp.]
MKIDYILDASAFINGFPLDTNNNHTTSEIACEIKDFKSKLIMDNAIEDGKLDIKEPKDEFMDEVERIIAESGDNLRLSLQDKTVIALALEFSGEGGNVKVITDDYTIQNTLKIMNIPFSSILTNGIKEVYNWKKICSGCKREYDDSYPFDDCEICGSDLFKKRVK